MEPNMKQIKKMLSSGKVPLLLAHELCANRPEMIMPVYQYEPVYIYRDACSDYYYGFAYRNDNAFYVEEITSITVVVSCLYCRYGKWVSGFTLLVARPHTITMFKAQSLTLVSANHATVSGNKREICQDESSPVGEMLAILRGDDVTPTSELGRETKAAMGLC